ncbi:NADH-quinone oxidoreductase subunit NuoE [Limimaricola pyoseonensis]|uniref:NADH dehydrogenase subunit E n=1 Tax=Limimaricola pyoseonensis TaxID=521013 RepID=A0A1G6ZEZ8_9RHOB|nr:NADH-quinone oxidoreductase subunit NuoE [Limimaricola pyoseonensis]SDE00787.1 NADH dehydrogenase subunit E [Limimaricola pyoseonensis]
MLRRLHPHQPESFAFTPANQAWAEAQITKYPEGRQASAVIPLLWRAQEQEGWLTRPAIEHVADMLGMAYIRVLEVATFYFMFQLQPVGSVAHVQVCGTLSCMLCGSEDLMKVCREKIADKPHELSADGKFSWEEVECLGACANAPMAQIGKDYYEDLTTERLAEILDEMAAGRVPTPGPQNGRYASEPLENLTSLAEGSEGRAAGNASVALATDIGDTIKRIDGTEVPLVASWQRQDDHEAEGLEDPAEPAPAHDRPADASGVTEQEAPASSAAKPVSADFPAEEPRDAVDGDETPEGGKPVVDEGEAAPIVDEDDETADKAGTADPAAPGGVYNAPKTQKPGGTGEGDKKKPSEE